MGFRLVVSINDRTVRFDLAQGEYELGSNPECAITIGHPTVSRRHAMLVVDKIGDTGITTIEALNTAQDIDIATLRGADEVWLASSTRDVLPVTRIDDQPVGIDE